ncbi:helix-turn-helix domain-containing protein [Streptomyces lateritius]|uniref:helix-turn-helix domain-containing protein n=1 Tax=Streptomyces lateritius TaxID=67313 RepID=UPI001C8BF924|nr:helix-turn-helix domain-containing protein [Streptomyces lateritius]MBX9424241.1 helix-turn-helix domain-containing protein [Streptomyces lateritius]
MGTKQTSARPQATSRKAGKNPSPRTRTATPCGGVTHDNVRHTTRFTVIGNHLAQHAELSLLAIGLAVHIQSLPSGASVAIKSLAARFPEGTTRIAAALRELEAHGYLRRTPERTEDGRLVTRTVSCNRPGHTGTPDEPKPQAQPERPARREDKPQPERPAHREDKPQPKRPARREDKPQRRALPAVPQPIYPAPEMLATALGVLSGLRRTDPRLLISATDAEHLVPGVAAWLERDLTPEAVHGALTTGLPQEPLHRPAALLAHRLTAQLPPLPLFRTPQTSATRHPLQNCDTCDRAYRAPEPGTCAGCTA